MKKSIFKTALSALLSLTLVTAFIPTAYAAESGASSTSSSDDIVGCLTLVANYHPGEDFTDGHSFLMFTSYQDDLTLNFTNLYGYYVPSEEYAESEKLDHSLASYTSNFRVAAADMYPGLTSEEYAAMETDYNALSSEDREAKYPGLAAAIKEYQQSCFTEVIGPQTDSRHRKTSATYTLDKGEYLTIGDYSMEESTEQMVIDAIMNSTLKDVFIADLKQYLLQDYTVDQVMEKLEAFLDDYIAGKYTSDEVKKAVYEYLSNAVGQTVFDSIILPYMMKENLVDGATTGGLFVNRELYRQKDWQSFDPDHVYSVEITQAQLNALMANVNGTKANSYSIAAHNCTTMATDAWNAAVGYDANEEPTKYYVDSKDTTFAWLEGLISTPKRVYEVLGTMSGETMPIVRGVEVPSSTDPTASDYTFTAPENAKYDGATQWSATLTSNNTDDEILLFYSSDEGTTWTTEAPIAAGTYLVKANVAATDTHGEVEGLTDPSWTFTVAQRSVTLTSGSASKVYDGEALTSSDFTVSGDGFVEGEGVDHVIAGTQTEVGTSENTFTYTFQDGTDASNYDVTVSYGTLEVTSTSAARSGSTVASTGDQMLLVALLLLAAAAGAGVFALRRVRKSR